MPDHKNHRINRPQYIYKYVILAYQVETSMETRDTAEETEKAWDWIYFRNLSTKK